MTESEAAVVAAELSLLRESMDKSALGRLARHAVAPPAVHPAVPGLVRRALRLARRITKAAAPRGVAVVAGPAGCCTKSGGEISFRSVAEFNAWRRRNRGTSVESCWLNPGHKIIYL